MKNKFFVFVLIIISFLFIGNKTFASITNGTIDTVYHYAWGENIGFVDFSKINISDTTLSGSIYGENIGWIDLSTITNTTEGQLSGYAWGENIGWVDFSKVIIGTDGVFTDGAYGENIGWITFGTENNKVLTDWRPESARPVPVIKKHNSTGTTLAYRNNFLAEQARLKAQANPVKIITKSLKFGIINNDVKLLQIFLNNHGYPITTTGAGSKGKETNNFGNLTKQAVMKFQKANKLKPDGIVGPFTLGIINQLNK